MNAHGASGAEFTTGNPRLLEVRVEQAKAAGIPVPALEGFQARDGAGDGRLDCQRRESDGEFRRTKRSGACLLGSGTAAGRSASAAGRKCRRLPAPSGSASAAALRRLCDGGARSIATGAEQAGFARSLDRMDRRRRHVTGAARPDRLAPTRSVGASLIDEPLAKQFHATRGGHSIPPGGDLSWTQ